MKDLICLLLFLIGDCLDRDIPPGITDQEPILSGIYQGIGDLYLIERGDFVFGFYQSYRQNSFSTVFFIKGKRINVRPACYSIKTFYPVSDDTIRGKLQVLNDREVEVRLERVLDGGEFGFNQISDSFEKVSDLKWSSVGYISQSKSMFGKHECDSLTKRYLVRFDPVLISRHNSGQVEVFYISKDKLVKGWVNREAITELDR